MSHSRDNRRARQRRAKNYQQQLELRASKLTANNTRQRASLSMLLGALDNMTRALGGPKVFLVPKIHERRDYNNGDLVHELSVRRMDWDGRTLREIGEWRINFATDRKLEQLGYPDFLDLRWKNAGSQMGITMVQWLRGQKSVDTLLTPDPLSGPICGPGNLARP
jgi:hypothetical protein